MKFFLNFCIGGIIGACGASDKVTSEDLQKAFENPPVPIRHTLSGDYLASRHAQNRKDWKTAQDYLNRVLDYDPENQDLQRRAMVLAIGSGDVRQGIATARKILDLDPGNALALMFLATSAIEQQDYQKALTTLDSIPPGSIADFIGPLLKAWSKAGAGESKTKGLIANSSLHAYHALLIDDFLGTLKDTKPYLEVILSNLNIDVYELEKIADILLRHGKKSDAQKIYQLIKDQNFGTKKIDQKLNALKQDKDYFDTYRVLSAQHGAAEALFDMARVLFREYSDDSAIIFARMALHLRPDFPDAQVLLADILARNDQAKIAIPYYRNISPKSPLFMKAQHRAADLMDRQGEKENAIELLQNLYNERQDLNSFIMIGDLHRSAENFSEALKIYNQAADKLGNDVPSTHWNLLYARGITHERLNNMNLAEKDLLKAIEYNPENPYILNYLGYSWADHGKNLERSLEMIQKAVAIRPTDGYIVDSLGWVYFRMGRYNEAVKILEKAVSLLPYDPTINDHLGDAYWKTGRHAEARFQWRRALNYAGDETDIASLESKLENGLSTQKTPSIQQAKTDTESQKDKLPQSE